MTQIVLTADQVQLVATASDAVELRDGRGTLLGYVARPPSDTEFGDATRRLASDGPWHTTEQVVRHLDSLEQG
ncbi:MAG: hypothetical protein ABI614_17525 [Planctomycetota bacterium]